MCQGISLPTEAKKPAIPLSSSGECLCMISLSLSTNAMSNDKKKSKEIISQLDLVILENEKARFEGVLVPEMKYKFYQKKVEESYILQDKIKLLEVQLSRKEWSDGNMVIISFATGMLVTGFIVMVSQEMKGKIAAPYLGFSHQVSLDLF